MKKALSLVFAVIMLLGIASPMTALAEETQTKSMTVTAGNYKFLLTEEEDLSEIVSSDTGIAKAISNTDEYGDMSWYIYGVKVGSAVISYTYDEVNYTVNVKVVKPTLSSKFKTLTLDNSYYYGYDYDEDFDIWYYPDYYVYYNSLGGLKVTSSDTSIASVSIENYTTKNTFDESFDEDFSENYYKNGKLVHYLLINPKKKGTVTFTISDKYSQKVQIKVTVKDTYTPKQLKRSKFKTLYYGKTTLSGTTYYGSTVKLKIGKKTYKTKANSNGEYKIKNIKICKIGTKFKVTFSKNGSSYTKSGKVKNPEPYMLNYYYYRNQTKFHGYVKNVHKGDKIVVKIGNKTYTKKVKKNYSKLKYSFKVKKNGNYGSKITLKIVNKFNQTMTSYSDVIYYSKNLKVGMTTKQVKYVPGWTDKPLYKEYHSYGTFWYYDDDDDDYWDSYLFFDSNNKLSDWYY